MSDPKAPSGSGRSSTRLSMPKDISGKVIYDDVIVFMMKIMLSRKKIFLIVGNILWNELAGYFFGVRCTILIVLWLFVINNFCTSSHIQTKHTYLHQKGNWIPKFVSTNIHTYTYVHIKTSDIHLYIFILHFKCKYISKYICMYVWYISQHMHWGKWTFNDYGKFSQQLTAAYSCKL